MLTGEYCREFTMLPGNSGVGPNDTGPELGPLGHCSGVAGSAGCVDRASVYPLLSLSPPPVCSLGVTGTGIPVPLVWLHALSTARSSAWLNQSPVGWFILTAVPCWAWFLLLLANVLSRPSGSPGSPKSLEPYYLSTSQYLTPPYLTPAAFKVL